MGEHDKPVGLFSQFSGGVWKEVTPGSGGAIPLYTHPAQWVGLTEEEVSKIIDEVIGFNSCWGPEEKFARAIEAALKEKNT